MIYIFFSTLCSVTVSVVLKLAPRWNVDLRQAIAGGYFVAAILCALLLHPSPALLVKTPSIPAIVVLVSLGILLPSIFLVMAKAVETAGVVRTDAAHRMSLLLSLIAAFTLFGEVFTPQKGVGILIGLCAIACIVARQEKVLLQTDEHHAGGGMIWLAATFFGAGIIDSLFKQMAQLTDVPYVDVLMATFVLALLLSMLYIGWLYLKKQATWGWQHAVGALLIGVFNFGNILLYIVAHQKLSESPAIVFSAMNIGVIVLATLIGVWFLKEKLSWLNRAGIALAIIAVAILAMQIG